MIPQEQNISAGLVFRGNRVFIYTPIMNNDIVSFVKIILNQSNYLKQTKAIKIVVKQVVTYCTTNKDLNPIPSILEVEDFVKN